MRTCEINRAIGIFLRYGIRIGGTEPNSPCVLVLQAWHRAFAMNATHDFHLCQQCTSPLDNEFKFACPPRTIAYTHPEQANHLEKGASVSKRSTTNPRSRLANPCVVEYLGQNFTEKGTMMDLSGDGMKILGPHPVHIGMRLALRLSVGKTAIPIQIPCAYVRWMRNQEFGVKFGPMDPAVMAQLHNLLSARQSSPTT